MPSSFLRFLISNLFSSSGKNVSLTTNPVSLVELRADVDTCLRTDRPILSTVQRSDGQISLQKESWILVQHRILPMSNPLWNPHPQSLAAKLQVDSRNFQLQALANSQAGIGTSLQTVRQQKNLTAQRIGGTSNVGQLQSNLLLGQANLADLQELRDKTKANSREFIPPTRLP